MKTSVIHWYPNFLAGGGVANSVLALARAQTAAGAVVSIVTAPHNRPLYGSLPTDSINVRTLQSRGSIRYGKLRLHLLYGDNNVQVLRALRPDVVHLHGEFNPDNWWPPRVWSCPLVLSPHGAFHEAVLNRRPKTKRWYMTLARHLLYDRLSQFHALNPQEKADIEASISTPSTYCVPQGPSPAINDAMRGDLSQRTTQDPIRFLFVGRLDVQTKGLDILLRGFALAARERADVPPVTISLVGPDWGEGRRHLMSLARSYGVADLVGFRDSVAASHVPALFRECDVYIQLSRNEGTPLSVNDALVLGKPAILSDRIGTTSFEQVSRLQHVQVIEPTPQKTAAAIHYAIEHHDDLRAAGQAAVADLRAFLSWSRAAELHLEVYKSLREISGSVLSRAAVAR